MKIAEEPASQLRADFLFLPVGFPGLIKDLLRPTMYSVYDYGLITTIKMLNAIFQGEGKKSGIIGILAMLFLIGPKCVQNHSKFR